MFMPHKHEGGESEYDCHFCQQEFGEHAEKRTLEQRVQQLEADVESLRQMLFHHRDEFHRGETIDSERVSRR